MTSYRCMPLLTTDQLVLPEICLFRSTSMEFGCQEAGGCLQPKTKAIIVNRYTRLEGILFHLRYLLE